MTIPRFLTFAVWLTRLTTSLLYLADNESLGLEHLNEASQLQLMEFPVIFHPLFSEEMKNFMKEPEENRRKPLDHQSFCPIFSPQLPSSRWCAQERKRP